MKKVTLLFTLLFSTLILAQTNSTNGIIYPVLGDSSDLPGGIWNGGSFGGSVSFGIYSGSNIYIAQGENFHKAEEGANKIESLEQKFLYSDGSKKKAFKINGDNLYLIYELGSSYESKITRTTLSDLGSSSSTQFSEITNGINKFEEIDGYVLLAHNKDGSISDKLVGEDFLNSTAPSFVYTQDFIDFTVNGSYAYLIADNGTTTRTIEVIDFSNKSNVTKVGEVVVTSAEKLAYSNGHLFITCVDNQGMQVVDVSIPTNPTIVGDYLGGSTSYYDIIIEGTKAYLIGNSAFNVLDISNPSNPYNLSWEWFDNLNISRKTKLTSVNDGKIYNIDLGNFGIIEVDDNNDITLGKQYLSPTSSEKVFSDGNNLVVEAYYGYKYYFATLEDKYSPNFYSTFSIDNSAEDFLVNGNYFYLIDYSQLYIYELSNLSSTPLSTYTYTDSRSCSKIDGNLGVVGGYSSFEIINLTDKSNPTKYYSEVLESYNSIKAIELSRDQNTMYLMSSRLNGIPWLAIYDITSKSSPVLKSERQLSDGPGENFTMGVNDSTLVIVMNKRNYSYNTTLFAYDISDAANPIFLKEMQVSLNEYKDALFIEELLFINVTDDGKLYTYTFVNSEGEFVAGDVVELDGGLEKITGFIDHQSGASNIKANNIMGEELETGYIYGAQTTYEGTKTYGFTKLKKKSTGVVRLVGNVAPSEAATDGCRVSPSSGEYNVGDVVTMGATAATGWVWSEWSGDLTGVVNPQDLTMDSDKNVTGNFQPILTLGFSSADAKNIEVPKNDVKVHIGGALLTADGVDWELKSLKFTALEKVKPTYIRAFVDYDGNTKEGTFSLDENGYISEITFPITQVIPENYTLVANFYYMFNFPLNEKDLLAPLDEIKKLGISYNRTQVVCDPVPDIKGVKLPQDTFSSNLQTIGWIWNRTQTPMIPFLTIQDANDFVGTNDGHTIEVWEGYYKYDLSTNISKSLNIKGFGDRDKIIIEGNDEETFKINADNVKIEGLTLENKQQSAEEGDVVVVKIEKTKTNITIENNKISCIDGQFGVSAKTKSESVIIKNNSFIASTREGTKAVVIEDSENIDITKNVFDGFNECISMSFGNTVLISENETKNSSSAISMSSIKKATITKNNFPSSSGINGVQLYYLEESVISDNESTDNFLLNIFCCEDTKISNNDAIFENGLVIVNIDFSNETKILNNKKLYLTISSKRDNADRSTNTEISGNSAKLISIKYADKSIIKNNTIVGSDVDGIYALHCENTSIVGNRIEDCKLNGIQMVQTLWNTIEENRIYRNGSCGISISSLFGTSALHVINKNKIGDNTLAGIYMATSADLVNITNNTISNSKYGIYIKEIGGGYIARNNVLRNCTGIEINNSKSIKIATNNVLDSWCLFTGIHLTNSEVSIENNNLTGNNGAAIGMFNGSTAEVNGNNIYDNPDLAVYSDNPTAVVNVDNNYWGSTDEPSSSIFDGNIEYVNWLSEPISLIVNANSDSVVTATGSVDSVTIAIGNYVLPNDQVSLTITDEQGWLLNGGTETIDIIDSLFSYVDVKFLVPSDAGISFNNKVTVSAVSLTNSEMTAVDSFYILNYTPELASIKVSPDSIALGLGDSLRFRAYATDQYEKEFSGTTNYIWTVSAGIIDSLGYFIADSTSQVVTVTATETNSNISSSANINIQQHTTIAETITIYPDSISVPINGTVQFYAEGKDVNGFTVGFNKEWFADGGTIDSIGYFTAGDIAGEYNVIVRDQLSGAESVAKVIVETPTSIETERIIPKEYSLNQNYPNPFNPSTTISYALPYDSKVRVEIFNVLGQRVDVIASGVESAGLHSTLWDATHLASGIYIIRINATSVSSKTGFTKSIKMILMK